MKGSHLIKCLPETLDIRVIFYFYTACLLSISVPLQAWGWDLAKEENSIRVYTRSVEGSSFKEYRSVMQIEASLSSLVALVDDIPSYPKWIHTCKKAIVLKTFNQTKSQIYTINNAPWPVSDRDAVALNEISQNDSTFVVTVNISGIPDLIPLKPGLVRVKKIKGFWRFSPLENGIVEVVYQVHNEPGGKIPAWLVNSIVVDQPFQTLLKMREQIKGHVYPSEKYKFINEKK